MILTIGRDVIVASVSLTGKHSVNTALFATSCRRNHSKFVPAPSISIRNRHRTVRDTAITYQSRQLSSLPPSAPDEVKHSLSETPPPIRGQNNKKTKVELRPAPVKVKASEVFSNSSSAAREGNHSPRHPSLGTTSTVNPNDTFTRSIPGTHPRQEGVIESAKHDFEAASSHGILKPPPTGANKLQTIIHQAKEYFKFYWNGLKLINTNRIRAQKMRARVAAGGPPLTRWETRFVKTYKEDALKLIPFALIIIIAEEAIPLVVLWAPFLLPSTCVLPAQKERILAKKRATQQANAEQFKSVFDKILTRASTEQGLNGLLGTDGAKAVSGLLGQSSWTLGISYLPLRRVRRHLADIVEDDALLLKEGLGERLTDTETREALEERGVLTDGLTPKQWQSRLRWWLTNVRTDQGDTNFDATVRRVLLVAQSGVGKF